MTNLAQGFPGIQAPLVNPATGRISDVWYRFLLALWNRTGGNTGEDSTDQSVQIAELFSLAAMADDDEAARADPFADMVAADVFEAPQIDPLQPALLTDETDQIDAGQVILASMMMGE